MGHLPVSDERSQCKLILAHLLAGHTLTPLEALRLFGCLRLGGRIFDLRKLGHAIEMEWEWSPDRKKKWARYSMARGTQMRMAI